MKKHLAAIRKGWQSENLARYILSNFAFISQPCTIADDIGSDFFCTIFSVVDHNNREYLVPNSSFAIQIKSSQRQIPIGGKIEYLKSLNIPYFVGVVCQKSQKLDIYSGEYLIPFLVDQSEAKNVNIILCDEEVCKNEIYLEYNEKFNLHFPKLVTIEANSNSKTFRESVDLLTKACVSISSNITSRNNGENIFEDYTHKKIVYSDKKNPIEESLNRRLLSVRREVAFFLEEGILDSENNKYADIQKALMKI